MYKFSTDSYVRFRFEIDQCDAPEWILEEIKKADMPDVEDSLTVIAMTIEVNQYKTINNYDENGNRVSYLPYMIIDLHLSYYPPDDLHEDVKKVDIVGLYPDDWDEYNEICTAIQNACQEVFKYM